MSSLLKETEVRVARALLYYEQNEGEYSIEGYGIEKYVADFIFSEYNQKTGEFKYNTAVTDYFNALKNGSEITSDMESAFRSAVQGLSKEVYNRYSKMPDWKPGQTLDSYEGETPYFDQLMNNIY